MRVIFASSQAFAQAPKKDQVTSFVGFGVFATPEFEGSEDMQAVPLIAGRVQYNQYYIESHGLGLRANISPFEAV